MEYNIHYKKLIGKQTKEDFVRKAYVKLYSAVDFPANNDVQFSDVCENTVQIAKQLSYFDIDYTAEIGYNREEQYADKESYYNKELGKTMTRTVIKNRTVTDWQPYSGKAVDKSGTAAKIISVGNETDLGDLNEEQSSKYFDYSFDLFDAISEDGETEVIDSEGEGFAEISDKSRSALIGNCYKEAEFATEHELPGDTHRNFRTNRTIKYEIPFLYSVVARKLAFYIDGEPHFVKQLSTEKEPRIYCSYKNVNSAENVTKNEMQQVFDSDPELAQLNKYYRYGTLGSLGLFIGSIALSTFAPILGIGILIAVIAFLYSYFVIGKKIKEKTDAVQKVFDEKRAQLENTAQQQKIEALNNRFLSMGLEALTAEEIKQFDPSKRHRLVDFLLDMYDVEDLDDIKETEEDFDEIEDE